MYKILRKTKKFFKSPGPFFSDSFLFKRYKGFLILSKSNPLSGNALGEVINISTSSPAPKKKQIVSNVIKEITTKNLVVSPFGLIEDYVTPHEQENIIFSILTKAGVNYHIVEIPWQHIIRIAIQDSHISAIIDLINENMYFTKKVFVAKGANRYDLVKIYFHDDKYIYKNNLIQLDPWYITPTGVMTRNKNSLLQFIPKAHINKTVHSFAPIRLGRDISDISDIDDIKNMIGIRSFMFDEYQEPIDIVYTWVSDSDPQWLANKSLYCENNDSQSDTRFVDYEQLRYSLRSVASYAKFIRNIYIVTDNQIPYWLDTSHEKIKIVNHSEIFEDNSVLPVFNSVAIECWIHKIDGLSENFIYANDDYFFGSPVTKSHFIHSNGVAKLFLEHVPNAFGEVFDDNEPTNQLSLFTAECFYKAYNRWPSFWPLHAPMIKNVKAIEEMKNEFHEFMAKTSGSRFRETGTISPLYLMFSYYSYEKGLSVVSPIRYEYVSSDDLSLDSKLESLLTKVKNNKCDVFCLNDHKSVSEVQVQKVVKFMQQVFPFEADWELDKDKHF